MIMGVLSKAEKLHHQTLHCLGDHIRPSSYSTHTETKIKNILGSLP